MKRRWFALVAAILLFSTSGCLNQQVGRPNGACSDGQCRGLLGGLLDDGKTCGPHEDARGCRQRVPEAGPAGPPTAAYAYPYYTLHGPRDFLLSNPPSLGR